MPSRYIINIYAPDGTLVQALNDWNSLTYSRKLNNFDDHVLMVNGAQLPLVQAFSLDSIIEVRRFDPLRGWYRDYIGFHRTPQYQLTELDKNIFTSYGRGLLDLIKRRVIAYRADSSDIQTHTTKVGPGESAIKSYINENAGPAATILNGRLYNGVTRNLIVEVDNGLGNSWHGDKPYLNLLDVVQDIGVATGIDFDVVCISLIPLVFEFRTYYPFYGMDKTTAQSVRPPVVFSPNFANMTGSSFTVSRTEEATLMLVAGQGQDLDRAIALSSNLYIYDSPWNQIEAFKDQRNEADTIGLQDAADQALLELSKKESIAFTVEQTATSRYGVHYDLGDIVTVQIAGQTRDLQIVQVDINVSGSDGSVNAPEVINITFGQNHVPTRSNPIEVIAARIRQIEVIERSEQAGALQSTVFAKLPPAGQKGRGRFCEDCLKLGEATPGTGTYVYDDGVNWIRTGDDTVAST